MLDAVDVEIQNALDLLFPAHAAFFEPFKYIRRNSKVCALLAASLKAETGGLSFMP
jgi:hypothetical protein